VRPFQSPSLKFVSQKNHSSSYRKLGSSKLELSLQKLKGARPSRGARAPESPPRQARRAARFFQGPASGGTRRSRDSDDSNSTLVPSVSHFVARCLQVQVAECQLQTYRPTLVCQGTAALSLWRPLARRPGHSPGPGRDSPRPLAGQLEANLKAGNSWTPSVGYRPDPLRVLSQCATGTPCACFKPSTYHWQMLNGAAAVPS
jgi:hypothetical protein